MVRYTFILLLAFIFQDAVYAQELNASFSISTPQLQSTDPQIFKQLENDINDFLNNQAFTDEEYEDIEKIKCNFQMTIRDELGNSNFTADLTIQSSRPVYGSEYETVVFTFLDGDVKFSYDQGMPIQYASDGYVNNLSSILSFYALLIIGYDYDTFSPNGGEPYFKIAENIVTAVPTTVAGDVGGWQPADGDRNRFWLVENMLNPKVADFRIAMYRYHLKGLDVMHQNTAAGQAAIADALDIVKKTRNGYPNNMVVPLFALAKSDEIVEIMAKATRTVQKKTYDVMTSIDPPNQNAYRALQ